MCITPLCISIRCLYALCCRDFKGGVLTGYSIIIMITNDILLHFFSPYFSWRITVKVIFTFNILQYIAPMSACTRLSAINIYYNIMIVRFDRLENKYTLCKKSSNIIEESESCYARTFCVWSIRKSLVLIIIKNNKPSCFDIYIYNINRRYSTIGFVCPHGQSKRR